MFKSIGPLAAGAGTPPPAGPNDPGIRRLFMVLHGFYGNLFLSKYSTGSVEGGEDQGIANARQVWSHGLREFDSATVKTALGRCQEAHPEFPPSLPQFVALCRAAKPREVYRPPVFAPALEMSQELRDQRRNEALAKAREIVEAREAVENAGLNPLKRAIANAVACAGGDEVAVLLRLDRMLAPKVAA